MVQSLPGVLFAAVIAVAATGQTRVSLQGSGKPSELEQQVLKLGQESSRPAAMAALFAAGRPAVPLLLKAAQNDDALSLPALRVLTELGAVARSAQPALLRLGSGKKPLARAAAHAAAAIGERDSVVFADWSGNRVVELDAQGQLLREVKVNGPWCVQVVADDHLLVSCHAEKVVREIDWGGNEIHAWKCEGHPIQATRLPDGGLLVAEQRPGRIRRLDAGGVVLAEWAREVRSFRLRWNDNLLLLFDAGKLVEVTQKDELVREYALGNQPLAFDVLADGRIRILYQNKLTELDANGKEVAVELAAVIASFAVVALRDGSLMFGESGRLTRRNRAGEVQWQFDCKLASCVVPRLDVPDR